jgi:aspartyl-tRNA(Asn)/glutamyl-tRNA(Gln) amidotransferase subunit C
MLPSPPWKKSTNNKNIIMSHLTDADIKKIAGLAKLSIKDEDFPVYQQNLSNILNLVEQMNRVDTSSINPIAHPFAPKQRLRADIVTEIDNRELFQSFAPMVEAGLYLVPKVIEKEKA